MGSEAEAKEGERDGRVGRCPSWYVGSRFVSPRISALWLMLVISKVRSLLYWWIYIFKCNFALDKIYDHPREMSFGRKYTEMSGFDSDSCDPREHVCASASTRLRQALLSSVCRAPRPTAVLW